MLFLTPNQQCRSTTHKWQLNYKHIINSIFVAISRWTVVRLFCLGCLSQTVLQENICRWVARFYWTRCCACHTTSVKAPKATQRTDSNQEQSPLAFFCLHQSPDSQGKERCNLHLYFGSQTPVSGMGSRTAHTRSRPVVLCRGPGQFQWPWKYMVKAKLVFLQCQGTGQHKVRFRWPNMACLVGVW